MSQRKQPLTVRLSLLGPPQVERDGGDVPITTRKATALLAFLAVTGQVHSREALATMFWPEYDQRRAFANLRRTLWILNDALGKAWLDINAETTRLRREAGLWLDVAVFRHQVIPCPTDGQTDSDECLLCLTSLVTAVGLYRDDFMAGFTLPDCPAFDEWQFFERESLRSQLADALQRLVRCHTAQRDYRPAITYARRWLALDPMHEPAHRALMALYAWDGQRAAALRQYRECEHTLENELGAQPEEETTRLYEAIQAKQLLAPSEGPVPGVPTSTEPSLQPALRHNLPPQPTLFVGRKTELAEIARLLQDPNCRLLTLVGPGGVGKSRLALEAAAEQRDLSPSAYPDGVCFVPLAPLSSDEFVVPTIAAELGFAFYPREGENPKLQLLNYLSDKQMLLLLDNFEQLKECAVLLSEILEHAPGMKLLVTSRERLNLQAEWVFAVQGMAYPGEEPVHWLEGYSAVELFLRRARQVDSGFSVPEGEISDLIRICRLVEGMPLGIELSAAWVKMLSCREIADEIERSLDFLTTSMQDIPKRHQSLRAMCDHSWALLSEQEAAVFERLSVFRGGFERDAAERVAGASLPLLAALVDKSLVRRERSGRYEVHEVLRQYAVEKLDQAPQEKVEARDRHSAYFTAFLQQREKALKGADQVRALQEIDAEIQNVRTAWHWSIAHGKVAEIRNAASSLRLFYEMRNLFQEGEQAFAQAVTMLGPNAGQDVDTDLALGVALAFQGRFAGRLYRYEAAAPLFRESQSLLRLLGARSEIALANALCCYSEAQASFPDMEQLLQASLAIYQSLGDRWGVAFARSRLLWVRRYYDWRTPPGDAKQDLEESLAIARGIGDRWTVNLCLFQLGAVLQASGAYREAKQRYQESLVVAHEVGDRQGEQTSLDRMGYVARAEGKYEEARQYHLESLAIAREIGDRLGTAGSLDNLGLVARDMGDYSEAGQYALEGLAIRREVGHQWSLSFSLGHLGDIASARENWEEARRWYQESLEVGSGGELARRLPEPLRGLGEVASAEGDFPQARQHFRDALKLEITQQRTNVPLALETVVSAAHLAIRTGENEKAAEWLTYVAEQAGGEAQTRNKALHLLAELASQLPPQAMAAAREASRNRTLEEVVEGIMQELRPGSEPSG